MNSLTAILLGVLQGVTEFIPVSSTGHLILGRDLIGVPEAQALAFDAILQTATALAVFVYFLPSIQKLFVGEDATIANTNIPIRWRSVAIIALATVPGVVAGLLLEPLMSTAFRSPQVVAIALIVGSLLILAAEHLPDYTKERELDWKNGLVVGLFQCLALVPGMSRSGSTISGGLLAGFSRETATSFSFLLGLPILLGAGGKKFVDLFSEPMFAELWVPLLVGCIFAFVSGLLAMHVLMRFVQNHRLDWFAWYRIAIAVLVLILL